MAKSPQKRITQSINFRPDGLIGGGIIPPVGGKDRIVPNAGNITSLSTNPISPELNSNFIVIVTIQGNFSDGVSLQYNYTRVNGSSTGWISVPPTVNNNATFTLASGLENGSASIKVKTVQNNIEVDQKTLAFNIIGEESSVPFLFLDQFGGGRMQAVPWHGGNGSNYPAGGISFQDENIISGNENANINRSFFNSGGPFSLVARRSSTTRTLEDDGITWEGEKTAVEKSAIFADESYDGVQFIINSYFEPAYVLGFRKFIYFTPQGRLVGPIDILPSDSVDFNMNGLTTDWFNQSGSMQEDVLLEKYFSTAVWTALGPSGSTAPDGTTLGLTDPWSLEMSELGYYDPITTGYARPWTTNGYPEGWFAGGGDMMVGWNKDDVTSHRAKEGTERDRRYSWQTYLKTWIDSKAEIGDPVEVAIYLGRKVPYKTRESASIGNTTDIDWGNLSFVNNIFLEGSAAGGWQITGGTAPSSGETAVTAGRQGNNLLSPWQRSVEPRVGSDSESWTSTGDKYFWDEQISGWTGCNVTSFYIDAYSDLPNTNPKFVEYFSNRNLVVGTESWPMEQTVPATGYNRYFSNPWIGEVPYIVICNNGSGAFESRGWQNFNWTTGKQYHPRPDLGGIPGDGITPTGSDVVTIREETPGSGPERTLVYSDGTAYNINDKPKLYIKVVFGNGGTSSTSGWNASFRLSDPVTGANVRRTSGHTSTPVIFEADTTTVSTNDADFYDEIPRHYNELLMKNDLDKMIDYGYIPSFSQTYQDVDGQGLNRVYRNEGTTREDVSLLGRLHKYINARLAGFSATDTQATQWLYLDLYNDDGSLITDGEVTIQSFTIASSPVGVDGGGVTGSITLNYYQGVTSNIDWRVYFKEDS